MAMIKCPECGKDVSDRAVSCPNCGCPIFQQSNNIFYRQEDTAEDVEMEESKISIASLVFFIFGIVFVLLRVGTLATLSVVASFVLVIIAHFQKDKKVVCATIVFWIITAGFVIIALLGIIGSFFGKAGDSNKDYNTSNVNTSNVYVEQRENVTINEEVEKEENNIIEEIDSRDVLNSGTYIVGEDINSGKYNFEASKGTGTLYIYNSYEEYKNDEYGFEAFRNFDMLAEGASVGLLNEDVYTDSLYNIRIEDGQCLVVDKGLELYYEIAEYIVSDELGVGTYVIGEDIEAGKYDLFAIKGSGSVNVYNSYDEYANDQYGFEAFESYDMKEENASVGMLNEDVYTQSISNVRLEEGQCLVIEKGLKIKLSAK